MEFLNGEAVSVGAPEGDEVTDIGIGQSRSDPARLAEGAFDILFSGLGACDAEGALSLAVDAVKAEHAGTEGFFERFMLVRVLELESQGSDAGRFVVAGDNFHDRRLVDAGLRVVNGFCHGYNFDISCKVSVIPMSTGHWREHRPHPLQLFTLNLPGK